MHLVPPELAEQGKGRVGAWPRSRQLFSCERGIVQDKLRCSGKHRKLLLGKGRPHRSRRRRHRLVPLASAPLVGLVTARSGWGPHRGAGIRNERTRTLPDTRSPAGTRTSHARHVSGNRHRQVGWPGYSIQVEPIAGHDGDRLGRVRGGALAMLVALVAAPIVVSLVVVVWDQIGNHTDWPNPLEGPR